jgi:hypothetical protein
MPNDSRRERTPQELQRQRRKQQIQRRRLVAVLCLVALIIVIIVLVTTCGGSKDEGTTTTTSGNTSSTTLGASRYEAALTGADSVPAVKTSATGSLVMNYDPEAKTLTYNLEVQALTAPSVANIYEGAPGDSGTAVYTLFAGPAEKSDFSGVLAQGTIDEANLTGSLKGATVADLIALIKDGQAYVSVGTTTHPTDAIRGQIAETTSTDTSGDTGSTSADDTSSSTTSTT